MKCRTSTMLALLLTAFTLIARVEAADEAKPEKPAAKEEKKAAEQVRLYVEGAYCQGCAGVLREALELSGFKNPSRISANGGQGFVIVYGDFGHASDLSKVALAINGAQTPHKKISQPGVSLELFAKVTEESAPKALKALKTVKGVDVSGSKVDAQRGVISVRLVGEDAITVAGIISALQKEGIEAKVETDTVKRFITAPPESAEKPAE